MRVYADTPGHKVFVLDKLVVLVWRAKVSKSGIASVRKACREAGETGLALLTIVHADTPPPEAEDRVAIAGMLHDMPFLASAVVHEGHGVRQATVIGIAIEVSHMYKLDYHHRVFPRLELAFAWLKRVYPTIDMLLSTVDIEGH